MRLSLRNRSIEFPRRPLVMGIVNANDDSFCGDGSLDPQKLLETIRRQAGAGADMIDLGAESARTNREAISCAEEIRRLHGVLRHWDEVFAGLQPRDSRQIWPPVLSINTWRGEVVAAMVEDARVELIDDMSGAPERGNAQACAEAGVALLIMHTVGEPKVAHTRQHWDDVMGSIESFFEEKIRACENSGLPREKLVLDPGIGFAKQSDDNLTVYRELERLQRFDLPLLMPVSRKSVIGTVLGIPEPSERDAGTIACVAASMRRGARIFRVHNVAAAWQAIGVLDRLWGHDAGTGRSS